MRHRKYVITLTPLVTTLSILLIVGVFVLTSLLGFAVGSFVGLCRYQDPPETAVERDKMPSMSQQSVSLSLGNIPEETMIVYYDCPLDKDLQDYIRGLCEEMQIPMELVLSVIEVESSFRSDVISGTSDYGLMQINRINHSWLIEKYGITDFLDPYQNVLCGITILSQHYKRFGDTNKALMAYNLGATGAKRCWDIGIYETRYTQKVNAAMEVYKNEI